MSKKNSILIVFSIVIIYLIYSNKYLLTSAFDYFSAPKDTMVKEESVESLDTDKSLENFLIHEEEKRQSYEANIENEKSNNEKIQKPDKKLKKEEASLNQGLKKPSSTNIPLDSIKTLYMKDFSSLETSFKNNIDSLITNALSDYQSGKYSKKEIAKKYLNQGELLEENSDKKFYSLLDQMKEELESNQHPLDMADDIKTYYETYKKTEKNKLVEKGMSMVKND